MSETKMEKFIAEIEEAYGLDNQEGVRLAVSQLKRSDVNEMATRWVLRCIAARVRTETRTVERIASVTEMHESVSHSAPARRIPKSVGGRVSNEANWKNPSYMSQKEYAEFEQSPEYGPWMEAEREFHEARRKSDETLRAKMEDAVSVFVAEMKVQWTQDLLDSQFNMPDGTPVTWGTATREQHEARIAMFKGNAMANLEGAARHQQALDELNASGAETLLELSAVAA